MLMSYPSSPLLAVINFKSLGPSAFLKAPQMSLMSTKIGQIIEHDKVQEKT